MSNLHGSKWIRPEKRHAIYQRDGRACIYCLRPAAEVALTLDHLHPRELGGGNDSTNLVTACVSCNSTRKARPLILWLDELHRKRGVALPEIARRIRNHRRRRLRLVPRHAA